MKNNTWLFIKKKSHTCEEGGAQLTFWYLLMNFENQKKTTEIWENEKLLLEMPLFHICVLKTTFIWGTVPEIWSETEFFVILGHFLPFYPP